MSIQGSVNSILGSIGNYVLRTSKLKANEAQVNIANQMKAKDQELAERKIAVSESKAKTEAYAARTERMAAKKELELNEYNAKTERKKINTQRYKAETARLRTNRMKVPFDHLSEEGSNKLLQKQNFAELRKSKKGGK